MSEAAAAKISQAYATLRSKVDEYQRTLPVTARTLETIIRLATAHAKLHLRGLVGTEDADFALALLYYALFKDEVSAPHEEEGDDEADAGKAGGGGDDDDDDGDMFDFSPDDAAAGGKRKAEGAADEGAGQRRKGATTYSAEELRTAIDEAAQQLCFEGGDERSCTAAAVLEQLQRNDARFGSLSLAELDSALSGDALDSERYMYVEGALHVI